MNKKLLDSLKDAEGRSEYVISLFIDIRGFSDFSFSTDSVDLATYITKIYEKILSGYFPDATFSKPMGDGLFVVIRCNEENIRGIANEVVKNCIKLIQEFGDLCKGENMITFPVPNRIGIGLTRGSVCCIHVGDDIVDYSGKILNYGARLMDKARPSGLICDYESFHKILSPELMKNFNDDAICLRGVAETQPMRILYTKDTVIINEEDRKPIREIQWKKQIKKYTYGILKAVKEDIGVFPLENKPLRKDNVVFTARFRSYKDGKAIPGIFTALEYDTSKGEIVCCQKGNDYSVEINMKNVREKLAAKGIPDSEEVIFEITYMTK